MWSKTKKQLDSLLCDSLKYRVKYISTSYRKTHDYVGRVAIAVDGITIFNMCTPSYTYKLGTKKMELDNDSSHDNKYDSEYSTWWEAEEIVKKEGVFASSDFFNVLNRYFVSNVHDCINDESIILKVLALLDRRIGKRTLLGIKDNIAKENEIVKYFFRLRCEAEGIYVDKCVRTQKE